MNSTYADLMVSFFKSLDKETERNPETLALAYANFFRESGARSFDTNIVLPPTANINNVSILSNSTPLSFLTKRAALVADTTLLTHYGETKHQFWHYSDSPPKAPNDGDTTDCYLRCPNLIELGNWIRDCKPLLLTGDMFYFPDIVVEHERESWHDGDVIATTSEESIHPLCEVVIENRKLVDSLPSVAIKSRYIRPILEIDLPCVDNVDLSTFCKITLDEKEATEQFRDHLRLKFLDMKENEESEFFDSNLAKIGIEIRDGVRKLNSQLSSIRHQRAFQVTGAAVGVIAASLVAINNAALSSLPEILGTSGGIFAIAKAVEQYIVEKKKIQDSPYYYLWLIEKKL